MLLWVGVAARPRRRDRTRSPRTPGADGSTAGSSPTVAAVVDHAGSSTSSTSSARSSSDRSPGAGRASGRGSRSRRDDRRPGRVAQAPGRRRRAAAHRPRAARRRRAPRLRHRDPGRRRETGPRQASRRGGQGSRPDRGELPRRRLADARPARDACATSRRPRTSIGRRTRRSSADGADPTPRAAPSRRLTDLPALVAERNAHGLRTAYELVETREGAHARVAPPIGLTLYRITQEALANISRHSTATTADVVTARGRRRARRRAYARSRCSTTGGRGSGTSGLRAGPARHARARGLAQRDRRDRCPAHGWLPCAGANSVGGERCRRCLSRGEPDPGAHRRRPAPRAVRLHDDAVRRGRHRGGR